jgi:hypothetical protein
MKDVAGDLAARDPAGAALLAAWAARSADFVAHVLAGDGGLQLRPWSTVEESVGA